LSKISVQLFENKKSVLFLLIALVSLLGVTDVILRIFYEPGKTITERRTDVHFISEQFENSLSNYAVPDGNIKRVLDKLKNDTLYYYYTVDLPKAFPQPLLLQEIRKLLPDTKIKILSYEFPIDGETKVEIFADSLLRLRAKLNKNPECQRREVMLFLVISEIEPSDPERFENSLRITIPFSLALRPGEAEYKSLTTIGEFGKSYCLILDDDVKDENYLIDEEYTKTKISRIITNIARDFSGARFILVDPESALFNSPIYDFVEKEFKKWRITLLTYKDINHVIPKSDDDIKSVFTYLMTTVEQQKSNVFLFSREYFEILQDDIHKFKKKGLVFSF